MIQNSGGDMRKSFARKNTGGMSRAKVAPPAARMKNDPGKAGRAAFPQHLENPPCFPQTHSLDDGSVGLDFL